MVELAVLPCHPERPPDCGKRLVGGPRREPGPEVGPHLPERGGRQAVPRVGGPFGVVVAGGQLRGPREAGGGSRPGGGRERGDVSGGGRRGGGGGGRGVHGPGSRCGLLA